MDMAIKKKLHWATGLAAVCNIWIRERECQDEDLGRQMDHLSRNNKTKPNRTRANAKDQG